MILSAFGFKENGWELLELSPLQSVNLLVAKNASGKTRTIKALRRVTNFIQTSGPSKRKLSFEANLEFKDENLLDWRMSYSFRVKGGVVEKEELIVNKDTLIKRTASVAMYKSTKINPPSDKLVIHVRRDKDLFPEIEHLVTWAEGVTCVTCSDINPYTILEAVSFFNPYSFSDLVDALSVSEKKDVLKHAKELGYNIMQIRTVEATQGVKIVQLKEAYVPVEMDDMQLSNGMLRTLYILCFMAVIKRKTSLSMLLIDDLGEGLDYKRSIDLGTLVFNDCKKNNIQLITSSNDAFLMDAVDINYWHILRRNRNKISVINKCRNAELFRDFRMTGLSNFDLFSSDFIDCYLNDRK